MDNTDVDTARGPLIYGLQRLLLAACVVLGPVAILIAALANPPYYGNGPGEAAAIATNATSSELMDRTHLFAELIASYLLPTGLLVMAWLANRRSPWLATVGGLLTVLGLIPLALFVGQDSLYYDIARLGSSPALIDLAVRFNHDGIMNFYNLVFGLGSVLGPTVIGVALWRSRAVPAWAAACVALSRLPSFVFLAVPFRVAVGAVLTGVVLLLIGSIPAAWAVWRGSPPIEGGLDVKRLGLGGEGAG